MTSTTKNQQQDDTQEPPVKKLKIEQSSDHSSSSASHHKNSNHENDSEKNYMDEKTSSSSKEKDKDKENINETSNTNGEHKEQEEKDRKDDGENNQEETDQDSLAKKKATKAMQDEKQGSVEFRVVENDGKPESMILLTGLKNIFQKQLPKMPKEYIGRLVYDRAHRSMAVVRYPLTVVGGITFRPFAHRKFAEIVFCAIASTEQVKGYGSRLMTHVKDHVREQYDIQYFLTYADNYAIGYFKKQGFTTDITLDKSVWVGYIKDYEGGTIMQCTMLPKVKYLDVQNIILSQRRAVFEKILQYSKSNVIYPGVKFENGKASYKPDEIPGLKEAGWTPEMAKTSDSSNSKKRSPLYTFLKKMVVELTDHVSAWPFLVPVAGVPDYYDVIKEPMDLKTLDENVEGDIYTKVDDFVKDTNKIFNNCRTYNEDGTTYVKCANKLEKFFKERLETLQVEMGVS